MRQGMFREFRPCIEALAAFFAYIWLFASVWAHVFSKLVFLAKWFRASFPSALDTKVRIDTFLVHTSHEVTSYGVGRWCNSMCTLSRCLVANALLHSGQVRSLSFSGICVRMCCERCVDRRYDLSQPAKVHLYGRCIAYQSPRSVDRSLLIASHLSRMYIFVLFEFPNFLECFTTSLKWTDVCHTRTDKTSFQWWIDFSHCLVGSGHGLTAAQRKKGSAEIEISALWCSKITAAYPVRMNCNRRQKPTIPSHFLLFISVEYTAN